MYPGRFSQTTNELTQPMCTRQGLYLKAFADLACHWMKSLVECEHAMFVHVGLV